GNNFVEGFIRFIPTLSSEVEIGVPFMGYADQLPYAMTATFNGNGATANLSVRKVEAGTYIGTLPSISQANRQFVGWYTALSGGEQISALTKVVGNVTYYARWRDYPVSGVTLAPQTATIELGSTSQLTATVLPSNATNKALSYTTSDTSVATVDSSGKVTAKKVGTATITVKTSDGAKTATTKVTVTAKTPHVSYQTHVQNIGWQDYKTDGAQSGTSGKALRLEAIRIKLTNLPETGGISYRTHVQNIGWQNYVSDNALSGTSGKALRLEAIQIKLTGNLAASYDVYYRVHAQNFGWLSWAKNGENAGTAGFGYRLEAIEIRLVKRGTQPGVYTSSDGAFKQALLSYQTHVQNIGWQAAVKDGEVSGTSGLSYRLESIRIQLQNKKYSGNISYRTHVQNIGWQSYVSNNALSGTSGKALRLEAIQIKLTGEMSKYYDVYYRVHAQNFGWMGWAKNDAQSGTAGFGYRLEAIQIRLIEKGKSAPGSTLNAFRKR
ncbi:MAG: Ig-like domain-containing protein, partial [Streptococcaceae bacterium]|nr:Ig-like domain-containing protein [Streptococcaceae bacterium]